MTHSLTTATLIAQEQIEKNLTYAETAFLTSKSMSNGEETMIKLLLAVIVSAAILLLIGITVAEILEAKTMEWETKTIIKKEEDDDDKKPSDLLHDDFRL